MRRMKSFGGYTFPDTVPGRGVLLSANFGDGVARTVRLPGMDGGVDAYGDSPMPREVGAVRVRFKLVADTPEEMADARDAVMAMAGYGRAVLTIETSAGDERWTWAKVNSILMPIEHDAVSDRIADVTADFQIALPFWFSDSPDSPQVEACSGTATTFTVTNAGNANAIPVITVEPTTALASGVTIQRLVSAVVVDLIDYDAALTALPLQTLVVDCQKLTVRVNGVDAYSTAFEADRPAWMQLAPGDNEIKVILGGAETANVTVTFDDTWY